MMGHNTRSGYAVFRPRARLVRLIGAELISDEVVAVTELVKNAHDADASSVKVAFHGVAGKGGEILVTDDGTGMDLQTLLERWMEPANPWKGARGRRTPRGRRVLGEKGVGRFAADKLASQLELVSRCRDQTHEVHAVFDWDRFAAEDWMLADVKCRWEIRPAKTRKQHGTTLRMTGLRGTWNERMFRRLSTRLTRLISPFDGAGEFRIVVESDEFPEYSGELRSDILERAPYRIDARFDGEEAIDVAVNGSQSAKRLWNGADKLRCGPVRIRIFAFDLEGDALARIGPRMEVRGWLREWTGVSIFRDGFRVWPYGEPHDDWLRLDQRRVNNPVVRLSNNQIVGFVEASRDRNPDLQDQTNREGLLHNGAFNDLRRLMYFVLNILEAERQRVRHPSARREFVKGRANNGNGLVAKQLEQLARRAAPDLGGELQGIARRIEETAAREAAAHRRFLEAYSDLAALGQAAIGLRASVRPLLTQIESMCAWLSKELNGKGSRSSLANLREIEKAVASIDRRVAMFALMDTGGIRRRRRTIDVPTELNICRGLFMPLLADVGIQMEIDAPHRGVLRIDMRPEAFHSLMHILAANSLDWLHRVDRPKIRVRARSRGETCEIIFSDNGPGIAPELAQRVFEPMSSGKEGGRGMGLTVAKGLVELHKGTIEVMTDGRRRGASIRLVLPQKRSRATIHPDR